MSGRLSRQMLVGDYLMAKIIDLGSAKPDDPIFSEGVRFSLPLNYQNLKGPNRAAVRLKNVGTKAKRKKLQKSKASSLRKTQTLKEIIQD